jgi:hypothetical protein
MSIDGASLSLDGLLQNRILAKMISMQHPDRPSSRPILPTSERKANLPC